MKRHSPNESNQLGIERASLANGISVPPTLFIRTIEDLTTFMAFSGGHCYFPDSVNTHRSLLLPDGTPHYSANEGGYQPLLRNTKTAEFQEYLTTALSKDAVRFVRTGDQPFCLYLSYNAPHSPLEAPRELIEKYSSRVENKARATYLAMIDAMDQGIGLLLRALEESGQLENTLIFFFQTMVAYKANQVLRTNPGPTTAPIETAKVACAKAVAMYPLSHIGPKNYQAACVTLTPFHLLT